MTGSLPFHQGIPPLKPLLFYGGRYRDVDFTESRPAPDLANVVDEPRFTRLARYHTQEITALLRSETCHRSGYVLGPVVMNRVQTRGFVFLNAGYLVSIARFSRGKRCWHYELRLLAIA
ncbi:MAG: hypothetical protein ACRETU_00720 [Steroidobacterales bacterium]